MIWKQSISKTPMAEGQIFNVYLKIWRWTCDIGHNSIWKKMCL